jgi:hypothetical protein
MTRSLLEDPEIWLKVYQRAVLLTPEETTGYRADRFIYPANKPKSDAYYSVKKKLVANDNRIAIELRGMYDETKISFVAKRIFHVDLVFVGRKHWEDNIANLAFIRTDNMRKTWDEERVEAYLFRLLLLA